MTKQSRHQATTPVSVLRNAQNAIKRRLGPIEHRSLGALTAYKNNPRKHPERQLV